MPAAGQTDCMGRGWGGQGGAKEMGTDGERGAGAGAGGDGRTKVEGAWLRRRGAGPTSWSSESSARLGGVSFRLRERLDPFPKGVPTLNGETAPLCQLTTPHLSAKGSGPRS